MRARPCQCCYGAPALSHGKRGQYGATLLVCCSAFRGDANRYPNLTVKKIPKMVLQKCEWGHDDYSLNVENLPQARPSLPPPLPKGEGSKAPQGSLFDGNDAGEEK